MALPVICAGCLTGAEAAARKPSLTLLSWDTSGGNKVYFMICSPSQGVATSSIAAPGTLLPLSLFFDDLKALFSNYIVECGTHLNRFENIQGCSKLFPEQLLF